MLLLFVLLLAAVEARDPGKTWSGPASQNATAAWLSDLYTLRAQWRAQINYSGEVYDKFLPFSPSMFIAPQSHIYDRFLYDPVAEAWTVDRFLDDLSDRYGGIDGVLLWCTYPNMGVDERSQFDLLEDLPGGLAQFKSVVAQFNARGVHVGLPYNPVSFSQTLGRPRALALIHFSPSSLRVSPYLSSSAPFLLHFDPVGHWNCAPPSG
jgi:hypothetical protein